jgi:hypothetical protein
VAFLHSLSGRYEGTAAHGQASGARTPEIPAYLPQLPSPSTKQPVIK